MLEFKLQIEMLASCAIILFGLLTIPIFVLVTRKEAGQNNVSDNQICKYVIISFNKHINYPL